MNIAAVVAECFHIDYRGYGHPVGLLEFAEIDRGIVNLAAHGLEPQVAQAGFHGSHQLSNVAGLWLDPDCSRKRDGIIFASELHGGGRGSSLGQV